MTSEELLEAILKIPEAQWNKQQARSVVFFQTLKNNPRASVWERFRKMPIPADIEKDVMEGLPPKEKK